MLRYPSSDNDDEKEGDDNGEKETGEGKTRVEKMTACKLKRVLNQTNHQHALREASHERLLRNMWQRMPHGCAVALGSCFTFMIDSGSRLQASLSPSTWTRRKEKKKKEKKKGGG